MTRPILTSALGALVLAFLLPARVPAQDMDKLKSAVVRVSNTQGELGAGLIVKIEKGLIYIVTASHVVRGNGKLEVFLYSSQHGDALPARLVLREYDNPKGLALLTVNAKDAKALAGLTSVAFGDTSRVSGESVKIIGFPDGTPFWTVSNGTIGRVEGNSLIFSGPVRDGNSGGPVILSNGQVVGLVIDTIESQDVSSAAKADVVVSYVNGLVPGLLTISTSSNSSEKKQDNTETNDVFCSTLNELLESSKGGFYSIVGEPSHSAGHFYPKIRMPGSVGGYVQPKYRIYNYMLIDRDKGKVESQFYSIVSKVKKCLPQWEENDGTNPPYIFHRFKRSKEIAIVEVYYVPTPHQENYYLTLAVAISSTGQDEH